MHRTIYYILARLLIIHKDYGGTDALLGINVCEMPTKESTFVVSLAFHDKDAPMERDGFCTGALVSQRHVVSCEHCLDVIENSRFQVFAESPDLKAAHSFVPFWWVTFDQWSASSNRKIMFLDNDILVLKIIGTTPSSVVPAQVSLITPQNRLFGLEAKVYGYGDTHLSDNGLTLQRGTVNILSNQVCEGQIRQISNIKKRVYDRYLCSFAEPYVQVSNGDSGGPLMYGNALIGINKGTAPRLDDLFHSQKVNVHIGIDYYREFIAILVTE